MRNKHCLLIFLTACLVLASLDLCGLETHVHHDVADELAGNGSAKLQCDGCGGECHDSPDGERHADHCSSCPCLCHVTAIMQLVEAAASAAALESAVAEAPIQRISDFKPSLDHPPLSA